MGTDNTKYAQYTDADKNTRSATSAFDVDLSSQDKYAVEFDLALTKSSKDDVQFVVASGTYADCKHRYDFKLYLQDKYGR